MDQWKKSLLSASVGWEVLNGCEHVNKVIPYDMTFNWIIITLDNIVISAIGTLRYVPFDRLLDIEYTKLEVKCDIL